MKHHCLKFNQACPVLMTDRSFHFFPLRVTLPFPLLLLIGVLNLLWSTPLQAVPAAPSNLSAVAVSSSQIKLTWSDNSSDETGFIIQRAATSSGWWTQIATTGAGVVSFTNSGLTAGTPYYYRVRAYNSTGSSAYTGVATATTQPASLGCTYSISPASSSSASGGGSGNVSVTAGAGCAWTATSSASWITITGGSSGSGNGTASYTVAANTSTSSRTGTLTIAGKTFTMTQSGAGCSYAISAASASSTSSGGSGSVSVTAGAGCSWTATSSASWITITGGSSGSGNGTVSYTVAANTSTSSRTGTLTIAGKTFTMTQGGVGCSYAISATSASSASSGGSGSVSVTAGAGCSWTATSSASWITITGGSSGSGNGTVSYTVAANTSTSSRTGTLTIAGKTFTMTQSGAAASDSTPPTVTLTSPSVGSTVSGTITLTANAADSSGVVRVEFYCDGTVLLGSDTTAPYTLPCETTTMPNGSRTFTCRAYDAAGNSALSTTVAATVNNTVSSGSGPWVTKFGGSGSDGGRAVAVDGAGNVYSTGWFSGTASFGGTSLVSAGGQDVFLTKSTASGSLLWARRLGGLGSETVTCIALDSNGNILLGGYFTGTANLGGGDLVSAGNSDIFLAKYDASGNHVWSQRFGGTDLDALYGVAVDSQGNVVITGSYRQSVNFGGGIFPSIFGGDTGFLAKYAPGGGHLWSKSFAGGSANYGRGVAVDRNNNILITGYFNGWINLGGGQLNAVSAFSPNIFIAKFAPTGGYVWAKAQGDSNSIKAFAIAVDSNADVVITGEFHAQTALGGGTLPGSAMYTDVFVAKYSGVDGAYRWARAIVGTLGATPTGIATDAQGNVLVAGQYYGTCNFGGTSLTSLVGQNDVFVSKYSSSGTPAWVEAFGGTGADLSYGVAVDYSGYAVVSGGFSASANFGTQTLTSSGSYDAFVLRLDP